MSRFYVFTHELEFRNGTSETKQQRVPTRSRNPWGKNLSRAIDKASSAVFNAEITKNAHLCRMQSRCDEIIDTGMNGVIRTSTPSRWATPPCET
jgi:hypothetical protein